MPKGSNTSRSGSGAPGRPARDHYRPQARTGGGGYGTEPALRLGEHQAQAFAELPEKTGRDCYELPDEAVGDLIDKYHRKLSAPKR